jgi:hypothetical protein
MGNCVKHAVATATGTCRECSYDYCQDCLVHPFGREQPPMCITCALAFAGVSSTRIVRNRTARVPLRERRRRANLPQVPDVSPRPDPDGGQPVDLPAWAR